MGNILIFSGRKSSGKNSAANILTCNELANIGYDTYINKEGKIVVKAEFKNEDESIEYKDGLLDLDNRSPSMIQFLEENLWSFIKTYSYADELKQFCINVFGLTQKQCFGDDNDKNSLTHLKWEDMPGIIDESISIPVRFRNKLQNHKSGYMTSREVLQYFGTEICRKIYGDCWVLATLNKIKRDNPALAIITDARFPNEVRLAQKEGAKVIRLLRSPLPDEHISEKALDPDNFDQTKFDAIIDNSNMDLVQQSEAIMKKLVEWGWYKS